MKKNLFLFLLMFICVFFLCISYADSEYGTNVEYIADGYEDFQITVPAKLAPSEKGYVVLEGTWDSNSIVSISADEKVDLKNTFNSNDVRSLNVNFNGINRVGNDFSSQKYKTSISVDDMSDDVLFGTWKGTFNYYVETLDANYLFADYIILPKLPELDEEEYPYAVMKYYNFTKEEAEELLEHDVLEDNLFFVDLCYYDEPVYYRENGNNSELVVLNSTGNVCFFYTESQELADFFEIGSVGKWSDASYMDFEEPTSINMDSDDVIWSNKDIVYKDNENLVFNYASNPKKIISFSVFLGKNFSKTITSALENYIRYGIINIYSYYDI